MEEISSFMKEINGTTTLSYLEEDNQQRVIFRVVPLCTREGIVFRGHESFPDEGSLRVVPDKREQCTFKERMRRIGCLCAIQLDSDGKEAAKVRQNRNYAPDQGERNRLAIYSDVICEFAEDALFEVLSAQAARAGDGGALTRKVLIEQSKILYGPVAAQDAAQADVSALKPFGNDRFLLTSAEIPGRGTHTLYWDSEALVNWRQRKAHARKHGEKADAANAPENRADAAHAAKDAPKPMRPESRPERAVAEVASSAPAQAIPPRPEREPDAASTESEGGFAAPSPDAALPIGTRLTILDDTVTFDEQLSQLAQPLSRDANRLSGAPKEEDDGEREARMRNAGTPLMRVPLGSRKTIRRSEPLHYVVERQMRAARSEHVSAEIADSHDFRMIDNPIDEMNRTLEQVWRDPGTREAALSSLMKNDAFMQEITNAMNRSGRDTRASAAAEAEMADIEAERLSLLMQLDRAKEDQRAYEKQTLERMQERKRAELSRLEASVETLKAERDKLAADVAALAGDANEAVLKHIEQSQTCAVCSCDQLLSLSPVMGADAGDGEIIPAVRDALNRAGFPINEDDVLSLVTGFSLFDLLCVQSDSIADAHLFAKTMLGALGLTSVTASVPNGTGLRIRSLLPENGQRTPTVAIQPYGSPTLSVYGHKTIYLAGEPLQPSQEDWEPTPFPLLRVPRLVPQARMMSDIGIKALPPVSLQSIAALAANAQPLAEESEAWFRQTEAALSGAGMSIPATAWQWMRRFVAATSRAIHGGFLAAADATMCQWIVPMLRPGLIDHDTLNAVFASLPRALALAAALQR